jgi:predicted metal-dependent phosphoesterase TrpH
MNIDFHCHTTASDGSLSPAELLDLAQEREIDMLSITDHDTLAAYQQFDLTCLTMQIIPGIELSSQWNRRGVHIVGLNVGLSSPSIIEAVEQQSCARRKRAELIAEKLERLGFRDCLSGAQSFAAGPHQIGRPHFARYLVEIGAVSNIQQAFKRYLGAGKAGDIKDQWANPETIISWIRDAGGVAVLAHPTKYKLTRTKLIELIANFKAAGGEAMEVISGTQTPSVTRDMARLCQDIGLEASCGSDFHAPNQDWAALGKVAPLPDNCTAVWQRWH